MEFSTFALIFSIGGLHPSELLIPALIQIWTQHFLPVFSGYRSESLSYRVLGTDQIEGKKYTKKNLNGVISFVIAFLVVGSSQLVSIINQALAQIVLLLLVSIMFLLLILWL